MSFFVLSQRARRILALLSPSPDGGDSMVDITYSDLVTAIGGSALVPGTFYRITDYATKHFIVDANRTQYLSGDGIITGTTEPLVVLATSISTIDKEAYSPAHPEDIIYYDWNPANWLDDLAFSDLSGIPTIISGFTGVITFRHDTLLDNYAGFDWRECKFRRWKTDVSAWDNGTAYTIGQYVSHNSKIFIALQSGTDKDPDTETAFWIELINYSVNEYWNATPGNWLNITSNDAQYADFNLFAEGTGTTTAIYELCCRANHFETFMDNNTNYETTASLLPNNVIFLTDENYFTCYSNSIQAEFFHNTIFGNFYYNTIGSYSYKNIVQDRFYSNQIGTYFYENIVNGNFKQNSIDYHFSKNRAGKLFQGNQIGTGFSTNFINDGFLDNLIGNNITNQYICKDFRYNEISNDSLNLFTNFSGSSHVKNAYTCCIYLNSDGNPRLKYVDGSDVVQYTNPTA